MVVTGVVESVKGVLRISGRAFLTHSNWWFVVMVKNDYNKILIFVEVRKMVVA